MKCSATANAPAARRRGNRGRRGEKSKSNIASAAKSGAAANVLGIKTRRALGDGGMARIGNAGEPRRAVMRRISNQNDIEMAYGAAAGIARRCRYQAWHSKRSRQATGR